MTRDEIIPPTKEWIARHRGNIEVIRDDQGNVTHARAADNSILAWLIGAEMLDPAYEHYAMVLMDMRNYFRRKVGYRPNGLYALEFFGGDGAHDIETAYLRVCRRIAGPVEAEVLRAIETQATEEARRAARPRRYSIAASFEKLARDIHEVREEMRKEEEERQKGKQR